MPYKDPEHQREAQREWVNQHRAADRLAAREVRRQLKLDRIEKIMAFKKDKPCADCGATFHPVAMDFDHPPGTKFYGISEMVRGGWKWERILEEIDKCDLVCANCHRVRTYLRAHASLSGSGESNSVLLASRASALPVGFYP